MSKLREHLNATVFPVSIPKPIKPIMEYVDVQSYCTQTPYDEQYVVEAKIRNMATMSSDLLLHQPRLREICIDKLKQEIIMEVFGEFKQPIQELYYAVYRCDQAAAVKLLDKLMEQMYG